MIIIIITSMISTFQCEYCQCLTFKKCNKIHEDMEVCLVLINLQKLAQRQSSKCCNPDFLAVRRPGSSWNFMMLRWINFSESFRHYWIHRKNYVMRFKKNFFALSRSGIIQRKALKVKIKKKVELGQVTGEKTI